MERGKAFTLQKEAYELLESESALPQLEVKRKKNMKLL